MLRSFLIVIFRLLNLLLLVIVIGLVDGVMIIVDLYILLLLVVNTVVVKMSLFFMVLLDITILFIIRANTVLLRGVIPVERGRFSRVYLLNRMMIVVALEFLIV